MKTGEKARKGYNAYRYRRHVRRAGATPDGQIQHVTRSFTNQHDTWYATVDTATGYVHCTCPDHAYRCARFEPNVLSATQHLCKHAIRAILGCVRRGEINLPESQIGALRRAMHRTGVKSMGIKVTDETRCIHCGGVGEFGLCDDRGYPTAGRVCRACVEARIDDLSDVEAEWEAAA